MDPDGIRTHVNSLRTPGFDPRAYTQKGYALRGSIKTDGHRLQVLAFKLRELLSVRYKRYSDDVLPDRLLSTTAGTDDHLTEVRNVFQSKEDVERLLGCPANRVAYLGIDPGQACVVGAYAYLPSDKDPMFRRNRHRGCRKRGSRGSKPRGSKRGKVKPDSRCETGQRHITLVAKQKAVSQPTFKHRSYMEKQKAKAKATELSISKIESGLPPLRGEQRNFEGYIQHRTTYKDALDNFYNGNDHKFKRHKWLAKAARAEEFSRLADGLLNMVGGTIRAKKKDDDKVVIGIGLGRFQPSFRLASLDQSFMAYFVKKARALGYLVLGVNEYYTSKKCPKCENFIGQPKNIRRAYCSECAKYLHRDGMAGHNIVNILRAHVEKQERPDYLQPVDEHGVYPWKARSTRAGKRSDREDVD
ncbi:hypothetical protein DFQ26_001677, partial [Actinomortierella ambigua]